MLIHIPKIISQLQINQLTTLIDETDYTEGKLTAAPISVNVKNNLQLIADTESGAKVNKYLRQIIMSDERFWNLTFFKEIYPFMVSRYETNMQYGLHLDNATMLGGRFRTDISMTIHLNSPSDYEGGELVIQSDYGIQACKVEMGDAIIYPANLVHEVKPITKGTRLVAVTWIQSLVREQQRRSILLDQISLIAKLEKEQHSQLFKAQKIFNNLLRMWIDN